MYAYTDFFLFFHQHFFPPIFRYVFIFIGYFNSSNVISIDMKTDLKKNISIREKTEYDVIVQSVESKMYLSVFGTVFFVSFDAFMMLC